MKIVFIDGTDGFSPTRIEGKPTGGILGSLTYLPRYLAKKGHSVWVKSKHKVTETIAGVNYIGLMDPIEQADIIVFNRNVVNNPVFDQAKATGAKVIWWLHDVVDPRYLVDDVFTRMDHIVSLSDYCTRTYSEFYGIDRKKFTLIPNGVDKERFFPGKWKNRNPNLFIYASAPIKGMKPLGFTISNLKRHNPNAELRLYASQSLHDKRDDALMRFQLEQAKLQGATILPPISQDELAKVMREAWALLMPNSYPEICSNLLLQARASGLPVIASPTGSIPEFLADGLNGLITKSTPLDLYFWWGEYATKVVTLSQDKDLHKRLSDAAPSSLLSWNEVGEMWHSFLTEVSARG